MSDSSQRQLPLQNFGFTAALLALAVSNVVLDGSIPKRDAVSVDPGEVRLNSASSFASRTWEDPFSLAQAGEEAALANEAIGMQSGQGLAKQFWETYPQEDGLLVVPVLLPNGRHQEIVEFRARTRTAIRAAFATSGWTCSGELALWRFADGGQTLPIEFFERSDHSDAAKGSFGQVRALHAVVAWIDFDSLPPEFANASDLLLDAVLGRIADWRPDFPSARVPLSQQVIDIRAIGPQTSNDLFDLLRQSDLSDSLARDWNTKRKLFSPWATIDDKVALASVGIAEVEKEQGPNLEEVFLERTGWQLERTTSTDDLLRSGLMREANRRSAGRGAKISLLTENSSVYGRAWQNALSEGDENGPRITIEDGMVFAAGIDGSVPRADPALANSSRDEVASDFPKGRGQVDYIKRHPILQNRLPMIDAEPFPAPHFLGLFATEVPDKIALAYAARFARPDALLFTSDLDSRFFHSKHSGVMRNTIIAAHFGLSLRDDLQRSLPPFRDSYQTASYFAALRVLGETAPLPEDHAPLLFEIGHGRAFRLSEPKFEREESVHPEPVDLRPALSEQRQPFLSVLFLIGLILVFALRREQVGQSRISARIWGSWLILIIVGLMLATQMTQFALNQEHAGGEPMTWSGGVSVWPAEYLRLAGCLLGIGFCVVLLTKYFQLVRKIELRWPELTSPMGSPAQIELGHDWQRFRRDWKSLKLPLQAVIALVLVWLLVVQLRQLFGGGVAPIRGDSVAEFDQFMRNAVKVLLGALLILTGLLFRDVRWLFHSLRKHKLAEAEGESNWQSWVRWIEIRADLLVVFSARFYGAVYYSATVLLLIVLGRSQYFDRWMWSWTQLSLLLAAGGGVLLLAYSLRKSAWRLRRSMLGQAQTCMNFLAQLTEDAEVSEAQRRVKGAQRALENAKSGALASTWNDPVLRALLVPISGMGAFELLYSGLLPT